LSTPAGRTSSQSRRPRGGEQFLFQPPEKTPICADDKAFFAEYTMADRLHAMLRSRLRPGIGKRLRVFTGWLSVSAPPSLFLQSSSSSPNNQWTLHYRLAIPSPPPSSMWDDFLNPPPTCIIFSRRPIFYCLHMPRNCKITHLYHELYSILANSCFRYNRKVYSPRILYHHVHECDQRSPAEPEQ
jgi:hypothetical protein